MNQKITVFLLCWATIAAVLSRQCFAQGSSRTNGPENYAEYKLFESVSSNAVQAFSYMTKCNENIAKLIAVSSNKVSSAFIASKVAWVEGRPTYAITTLEDVIQNNGESIDRQFGLPIAVLGNFWISTIARHFGDVRRVEKAYADIGKKIESNKNMSSLKVFCYLYQSEMEYQVAGNKNAAVEWLKKIKEIKPPANQDVGYIIYQEWADYQILVLTKGIQEARLTLKGSSRKSGQCILLIMSQLGVNGICGEPRVGFYNDDRQVFLEKALDMAVECRTSPIDRSLAQFLLATIYEKRDKAKAEKYYGDLLAGDSFFAPEGGIILACFQKKQGKVEESKKTFGKVKERFPGYSKLVEDLSEK